MLDDDAKAGLGELMKITGVILLVIAALGAAMLAVRGLDAIGLSGAGGTHRFGG